MIKGCIKFASEPKLHAETHAVDAGVAFCPVSRSVAVILSAIVEKLKKRASNDFKGRQFAPWLIIQGVSWYLRYPLAAN
jgi:hypothetical protein